MVVVSELRADWPASFTHVPLSVLRRYEEDMYWRRVEEEQHHWDDRRRLVDGGYPQGPPGLLGVRPGLPGLQPQGSVVKTRCWILNLLTSDLRPPPNLLLPLSLSSRHAGPTPRTTATS